MSAVIPVNDKYRIALVDNSWCVMRFSNSGAWEEISWHKTIDKAAVSLMVRFVSEQDLEGVDEIIRALWRAARIISQAIIESGRPDYWPK